MANTERPREQSIEEKALGFVQNLRFSLMLAQAKSAEKKLIPIVDRLSAVVEAHNQFEIDGNREAFDQKISDIYGKSTLKGKIKTALNIRGNRSGSL